MNRRGRKSFRCGERGFSSDLVTSEFGQYIAFLASRDFNVRAAAGSSARDVGVMADVGRGTGLHIALVAVAECLSAVEREAFPATLYRLNLAYTLRLWRVVNFGDSAATGSSARDVGVMADVGRGTALHIASFAVAESLSAVE